MDTFKLPLIDLTEPIEAAFPLMERTQCSGVAVLEDGRMHLLRMDTLVSAFRDRRKTLEEVANRESVQTLFVRKEDWSKGIVNNTRLEGMLDESGFKFGLLAGNTEKFRLVSVAGDTEEFRLVSVPGNIEEIEFVSRHETDAMYYLTPPTILKCSNIPTHYYPPHVTTGPTWVLDGTPIN